MEPSNERNESPTKELILSGRRGRNRMYKKRPRSYRKLKRSKTEIKENQPEITSVCDANTGSGGTGTGSLPIEQKLNEHHQKIEPVENPQSSLAHSLKNLQKLHLNIPKLDTPEFLAGSLKKCRSSPKSQTIQDGDFSDFETNEESLDENDAFLHSNSKVVSKSVKILRESYSNSKVSSLTERSIDENEEFEVRNRSASLNECKTFESATDEKGFSIQSKFEDALSEQTVADLNHSLDECMAKNAKDTSPQVLFTTFIASSELKETLVNFRLLCKVLKVQTSFCRSRTFRLIQSNLPNAELWPKMWKYLNEKSKMTIYGKQVICMNKNVLVIGAGPCGLRAAIECALLG